MICKNPNLPVIDVHKTPAMSIQVIDYPKGFTHTT